MPAVVLVSFTKTLDAVASGRIGENELREALFLFGCMRVHAVKTDVAEVVLLQRESQRQSIVPAHVELVRAAVLAGEREERVLWWRDLTHQELLPKLNAVLRRALLEPVSKLPAVIDGAHLKLAIIAANKQLFAEQDAYFLG